MSKPRPVLEGRTVFVTSRCKEREFLLRPGDETNQAVLYCLGHYAQVYGVELHALCAMSNHLHDLLTDHFGKLPLFLRDFHATLARCLNAHWGRWENLWTTEQTSVVDITSPAVAFSRLIYTLTNPVKDHLVEKAHHWPGATSITSQLLDKTIIVRRPAWFFDPNGDMPSEVTLRFTRPPGFEHLTHDEWAAKVREAVERTENKAAKVREEKNIRILGRRRVLRQSAFDRPKTQEKRRTIIRPRLAAENKWRRIELLRRNKAWQHAYRAALTAHRNGDKSHPFPFGTWQLVQDSHGEAAPGPGILEVPYALRLQRQHPQAQA